MGKVTIFLDDDVEARARAHANASNLSSSE